MFVHKQSHPARLLVDLREIILGVVEYCTVFLTKTEWLLKFIRELQRKRKVMLHSAGSVIRSPRTQVKFLNPLIVCVYQTGRGSVDGEKSL